MLAAKRAPNELLWELLIAWDQFNKVTTPNVGLVIFFPRSQTSKDFSMFKNELTTTRATAKIFTSHSMAAKIFPSDVNEVN